MSGNGNGNGGDDSGSNGNGGDDSDSSSSESASESSEESASESAESESEETSSEFGSIESTAVSPSTVADEIGLGLAPSTPAQSQTASNIGSAIGTAIGNTIGGPVGAAIGNAIGSAIGGAIGTAQGVASAVGDALGLGGNGERSNFADGRLSRVGGLPLNNVPMPAPKAPNAANNLSELNQRALSLSQLFAASGPQATALEEPTPKDWRPLLVVLVLVFLFFLLNRRYS